MRLAATDDTPSQRGKAEILRRAFATIDTEREKVKTLFTACNHALAALPYPDLSDHPMYHRLEEELRAVVEKYK